MDHPKTLKFLQTLISAVLFLGACQLAVPDSPTVSLPQSTPSAPPLPRPTTVVQDSGNGTDMTISGTAKEVSLSARLIRLKYMVDGFDLIAQDTNARLLDANANPIELNDVHTDDMLTAWGRAGESNVLIANKVELLGPSDQVSVDELISDCRDRGGRWEQLGILGYGCNLPADDAGKPCAGSGDCQGLCMPLSEDNPEQNVGACSAWQSNFGCNLIIEDGEVVEICID